MNNIFVYGSLLKGLQRERALSHSQLIDSARTHGELYDLGSYPGLKGGSGMVFGELYSVDQPTLDSLDRIEGYNPDCPEDSLYIRKRISATLSTTGNVLEAESYFYNQPVKSAKKITHGDYRIYLEKQEHMPSIKAIHINTKLIADKIDPFTKLYNHWYFKKNIYQEIKRCADDPSYYFSVLLIDIDNLMVINDCLGLSGGDQAIQLVANEIRTYNAMRSGGDKFFIILPEQNAESAYEVAECIRTAVTQQKFIIFPNKCLTVSIGIAKFSAQTLVANKPKTTYVAYRSCPPYSPALKKEGLRTIMQVIEDALCGAKTRGRNKSVIYVT